MIHLAKPCLDKKEARAAGDVILSGWVTQGPKVHEFEKLFAQYVGSRYACAVSSCTTALHLALLAVGVKPGEAVLTVSHSFIATANAIRNCGAEPVFIDIEDGSFNISPDLLETFLRKECESRFDGLYYKNFLTNISKHSPCHRIKEEFTGRVAAIVPVHQMGMPCKIEQIISLAKTYSIPVVEDAACAIGSEIRLNNNWERIGKPHGDVACFSFHPRKVLTTGDGGMLTTNIAEYDNKFKLLRQHGMNIGDLDRHGNDKLVIEEYVVTGFNYRMTDIQASIGIEQIKKLPDIVRVRQEVDQCYREMFKDVPWVELPYSNQDVISNWQSYPVRLLKNAPIDRDALINFLLKHKVASKPGIMNAHMEEPYRDTTCFLKNSENAREQTVLIPLYVGLTKNEVIRIVQLFKEAGK